MVKKTRRSRNRFSGLPNVQFNPSPRRSCRRPSTVCHSFPSSPIRHEFGQTSTNSTAEPRAFLSPILKCDGISDLETRTDRECSRDSESVPEVCSSEIEPVFFTDEPNFSYAGHDTAPDAEEANNQDYVSCEAKISNWRVLWALLSTNGNLKLTKVQYMSMKSFVDAVSREGHYSWKKKRKDIERSPEKEQYAGCLPHFTTLQKRYRPLLLRLLVPRSIEVACDVDLSKAGARNTSVSSTGQPQNVIHIIRPSEYARLDIATGPVWSEMKANALAIEEELYAQSSISISDCIDIWPLVAARKWFYGPRSVLSVDNTYEDGVSYPFAETGDEVAVSVINSRVQFSERLQRCFAHRRASENSGFLKGRIVHSWTVHHYKRKDDSSFQEGRTVTLSSRDQLLSRLFNFVTYTSPSDSVTVEVPNLPVEINEDFVAMELQQAPLDAPSGQKKKDASASTAEAIKLRRSAMRERKAQIQAAWSSWTKPLIKPGDYIVLLEPSNTSTETTLLTRTDRASRLCIVSRFWVENEERCRHVFFLPGGTEIEQLSSDPPTADALQHRYCAPLSNSASPLFHLEIREIQLVSKHNVPRGISKYTPVSSVGTLATGEPYFIYRYALYWDGFEMQTGKSASGDGFYLVCLNLPLPARSSPNGIRIVSLTPPGVRGDVVLDSISSDIVEGMTVGFLDYDADGVKRRIFLDLVGFMGDTPAINGFLDVLGHVATSCCHLCRFCRGSSTLIGSRYALGDGHGSLTYAQRGFHQHVAVRDCDASYETCRLLGIKCNPSSTEQVLHRLRDAMHNTKDAIPKTSNGFPVVSHHLDPYRACFIAPDHLLTGHLRDCICLVLKLLPSGNYSAVCEQFIIGFLRDAGLPLQHRLFDHGKKTLFSMSMTELFALSVVAEAGFTAGCTHEDRKAGVEHQSSLTDKCREAICLVGSCSKLIGSLCYRPCARLEGDAQAAIFEHNGGETELRRLQRMTVAHLNKVAKLCTMSDSQVLLLEDPNCSRQLKSKLSKIQRETLFAVKIVDKPNLHRLRELVFTTLRMVGHITRVGELPLEKTHQGLKRAIVQSNNREIHLHSMRSAAFSDWAGRLTMLASDALRGSETAVRGVFRLLAGREAINALRGCVGPEQTMQVISALGPDGCLAEELNSQGRSVLCKSAILKNKEPEWTMMCEDISVEDLVASHAKIWTCLKSSYHHEWNTIRIRIGDFASAGRSKLKRGDIVQILCYRPSNIRFHCPRVVQISNTPKMSNWENSVGTSLWCIQKFINLGHKQGKLTFIAALSPCTEVSQSSQLHKFQYGKYLVRSDLPISIAKLDTSVSICSTLHSCIESCCTPLPQRTYISHGTNSSPIDGGLFYSLTRKSGFPPRQG